MAGAKTFGIPRITYPIAPSSIYFLDSPRLFGRYSPGGGPGEEIALSSPFSISGGTFSAQAAAQLNVMGRQSAGAGAYEDCTRQQLNIAGTDLANTFSQNQRIYKSGTTALFDVTADSATANVRIARHQGAPGNASPVLTFRRSRGTEAAPSVVATNDQCQNVFAQAYDGTGYVNVALDIVTMIEAAPGVGAMGSRHILQLTPVGSSTLTEIRREDHTLGLQAFGANTYLDINRLFKRRPFTFATLPAAAASQDGFGVIIDGAVAPVWNGAAAGGGAVRTPVWSNGAAWLNG